MATRLDRLFVLLDTGSSPVTRKAAALQLGEVQKFHPHELHNLLAKVRSYLQSSQWETRIAAGQAIEAIINNVPLWEPSKSRVIKKEDESCDSSCQVSMSGRMKFEKFDINEVLNRGSCLLASEGKEFEVDDDGVTDEREKLAKQRQLLNKRLGLDMAEQMGLDTSDIYTNDDLVVNDNHQKKPQNQIEINKKAIAEIFEAEMALLRPGLSSREINKAKRKAKLIAKQKSRENQEASSFAAQSNNDDFDEPEAKRAKLAKITAKRQSLDDGRVGDNLLLTYNEELIEWPFETFCDQLSQDLFSPLWEIRHGASTALREITKVHGKGAGRILDTPIEQLDEMNQMWLEDMALRLLCVLALDRFGDFIADQVVAPVRETCAQSMAAVLNLMNQASVRGVTHVLLQLLQQKEWEARHGGLLGMKYLLAVRKEMTVELLPVVFPPIFQELKDEVDDVCAVAAAALVPVVDEIVTQLPDKVPGLISTLWDLLLDQDDLTTSTNSIMTLLASLLSYPNSSTHYLPTEPLNQLIPRLWPFLSHSSSSVRRGALQTLNTLACTSTPQPGWLVAILPEALRHIFQRCILEHVPAIFDLVFVVWKQLLSISPLDVLLTSACPSLSTWFCLMMQPSRIPFPPEMLIEAKYKGKEKNLKSRHCIGESLGKEHLEKSFIAGSESINDVTVDREVCVVRTRCLAAKLLGVLSSLITQPLPGVVYAEGVELPAECYAKLILFYLSSTSALQRLAVGMIIAEWAKQTEMVFQCPEIVKTKLLETLNENIYYDEIALAVSRLQQDCRDFIASLNHHKLSIDSVFPTSAVITLDQAHNLSTTIFENLIENSKLKPKILEDLKQKCKSLSNVVTQTNQEQMTLSIAVQAVMAGAVVAVGTLPEKLNPIIKPLMDAIKKEENEILQHRAAVSISSLIQLSVDRPVCPNPKIVKNLCTFLTADPFFTPRILPNLTPFSVSKNVENTGRSNSTVVSSNNYNGILTLTNLQKNAEKKMSYRRASTISRGRPPIADVNVEESPIDDETQHSNELQRRGAQFAFEEITKTSGDSLPTKIPSVWEAMLGPLTQHMNPTSFEADKLTNNDILAQELINSLQILEIVGPPLHEDLHRHIVETLPHLCACLEHPYTAVRHMSARCLGMLSKVMTMSTMSVILESVLPFLGCMDNDKRRQGAIEVLSYIIDNLGFELVPFIVLLIIPVLGRMSDPDNQVRLMATHCFATLIRFMPLEGGIPDPPAFSLKLIEMKKKERRFLEQLFDTKTVENYKIPIPIKAELREYQQDGVNWLAFLNKYKLHGILCDDMGLGKTLQSICILAGDHVNREQEYKKNKKSEFSPLPSLVVCPPTLTGHWVYEVEKFVSSKYLHPLHYTGPPAERQRLRSKARKYNLIIASYDIVRNDIDFFSSIRWNYCILDEGHIIKNGKTKLSRAIKQLIANHRLILSGTPIQNNVLELWSLFDFLMPGFLGTEKQFMAKYSKPILLSRDAKSSSQEQEAGALAMESLHRQVLPFLLRRLKEDVLKDLPPKIIQDYYCELSSLQEQLYEDFSKSRARKNVDELVTQGENKSEKTHIFQALQYLRKVCNHPKLVLTISHPEYEKTTKKLQEQKMLLNDIRHAAKLPALKQLLMDCGIGVEFSGGGSGPVVNQHRALIFCQLKSMLDILEEDLLKTHLPTVSYLRLDGSIPAGNRYSIVHRFNTDPSIDILLLTTQVGGLGLNLTGADTVIFVEHDWNPMKDLQAMDRAHRIGQKKVVNVYRLITKGTLEEKIMGLQKFKMTIANTVVSQENSNLGSMGTEQILELFNLDDNRKSKESSTMASTSKDTGSSTTRTMSNMLDFLPELWDEKQYESEYDLSNFLKNLKKTK